MELDVKALRAKFFLGQLVSSRNRMKRIPAIDTEGNPAVIADVNGALPPSPIYYQWSVIYKPVDGILTGFRRYTHDQIDNNHSENGHDLYHHHGEVVTHVALITQGLHKNPIAVPIQDLREGQLENSAGKAVR